MPTTSVALFDSVFFDLALFGGTLNRFGDVAQTTLGLADGVRTLGDAGGGSGVFDSLLFDPAFFDMLNRTSVARSLGVTAGVRTVGSTS